MQAPQNHGEAIVHIEFRSQPDKNMALRMLNYLTHLLNHDAPKTGEKSDELSPVLSIVVYNGKPQWHSKRRIQDRIRRMPHGLLRRCVQHSYVLIDIQRLTAEMLEKLDNVLALVMRFELPFKDDDMIRVLAKLDQKIARGDPLRETIRTWALAVSSDSSSVAALLDIFVNMRGTAMSSVRENFEAYFAYHERMTRQEAELKGKLEGKLEGRLEGQAEILGRLIRRRFGPLDDVTQTRIATADPATLNRWADAILTANTIEEVFATQH
jgi:predicted transposase/invertase (TIGR01784 family)